MPVPAGALAGAYPGAVPGGAAGYPGFGLPSASGAAPWGAAARRGSRILPVLLMLLLMVMLAFAGGLWFFTYGPGAAPKLHTVRAPTTLDGLTRDTGSAAGTLTSQIEARYAQDTNDAGAAVAFYGSDTGTRYFFLDLQAGKRGLTLSDLTTDIARGEPTFDFSSARTTIEDGVTFYCGPDTVVTGAFLCAWIDGNVQGMVLGGPAAGAASTLAAAERARNTAEH